MWSLVSRDAGDRKAVDHALDVLDRYHGLPNGMFSADEHYAGRDPSQGIELCAVVEAMYSLEQVVAVTGDAALADRLEKHRLQRAAGDVLGRHVGAPVRPAAQPGAVHARARDWASNGPESNMFGLEPNFGCCTANMHQGWPKFVAEPVDGDARGGLAAVVYGAERGAHDRERRAGHDRGRHRVSVQGHRHIHRDAGTPGALRAVAANPGVGSRRHGLKERSQRHN